MVSAVIVMVKNADNNREQRAMLAPESSETEDTIRLQK